MPLTLLNQLGQTRLNSLCLYNNRIAWTLITSVWREWFKELLDYTNRHNTKDNTLLLF